jgi:hypothetical protein
MWCRAFLFSLESAAKEYFQASGACFSIEFGYTSTECFYGSCFSGIFYYFSDSHGIYYAPFVFILISVIVL